MAASAGSSKPQGSGSSFSADLARELGAGISKPEGAGGGSDAKAVAAGSDAKAVAAGSDAKAVAAGSDAKVGDGKAGDAKVGDGKAGDAKTGDAKAVDAKVGDGKAGDAKAGSAAVAMPEESGAKAAPGTKTGSDARAPSSTATPAPESKAGQVASAPVSHGPVKVPAELAAIKLSLLPNWDRDTDEAGTFQYVVRIKGTQTTKTFSFRYGYDDPRAPADRDQYKKYLQDTRALTGEIRDRQRGAAWFLEGSDPSGMPAFRYVVLYGGKRLVCYGSLYKDAESSRLGDDRDQTLIQAKQICETLAL